MKTNVNLIRKLNDFDVVQRTKDSMFDATSLLKQWNSSSGMKKKLDHFFENDGTNEFINVLEIEENLNTRNSVYLKSRGKNGGTWMHPYLFVKFAMWLNPKFEYHVIKFVYDQLIEDRKLSGDHYNKLCSLLARFQDTDFREVGKILNYVVFNEHKSERRNSATPQQQQDLQQLTRDLCNYIELGFISSFAQFKNIARKEWGKRHNKVPDILKSA
ncbi:KilA-N domain-containing protein [Sphingobacterium mizutaii]|uniref:KilA-N domain-containing protein n=1 Tax=Sphingobacterium mizutaii TaxID=1010 RepID=UPI001623E78E|nr:KilA-N domain-containing protein [Sphingobacterium mizutaii]